MRIQLLSFRINLAYIRVLRVDRAWLLRVSLYGCILVLTLGKSTAILCVGPADGLGWVSRLWKFKETTCIGSMCGSCPIFCSLLPVITPFPVGTLLAPPDAIVLGAASKRMRIEVATGVFIMVWFRVCKAVFGGKRRLLGC